MGSLFKPKVEAPAPAPAVAQPDNWIDYVGRTKGTRVKNADGTYTMITEQLELTPEEKAYQDKLKQIENDSLKWIENLSTNYDRKQIPWLDKYLTDYETTQGQAINRAYNERTVAEETNAARFGVDDSTAANQMRQLRGKDFTADKQQLSRDLSGIEQDVRNSELNKAASLYSLASGRTDQLAQIGLQSIGQQQGFGTNMANLAQQRNLAIYDAENNYRAARSAASAQSKGMQGYLLGTLVGNAKYSGSGGFGFGG